MHPSTTTSAPSTHTVTFAIEGMSCGHCVAAVSEALRQLPGVDVRQVAVGSASVVLDPAGASTAAVIEAIRDAGYEARVADMAGRALPQAPTRAGGAGCCSARSV